MLIKKEKAKIVDLGSKMIRKYTAPDKQLEINHMILSGRTPEKKGAFLRETKVHFMAYIGVADFLQIFPSREGLGWVFPLI